MLGGWLGAGKTTLLNRLLASTDERVAVIVNDVGEINIDAALLRGDDVDGDMVELTNGCVCCSIGEDFELTLIELTLRDPAPDRIVVEASGVADPAQIAAFAQHRRVRLDAVVCLAEAAGFTERSSRPPYGALMRAQVQGADLVIATKLDLLDPADRDVAVAELRAFTEAPVFAGVDDQAALQHVVFGGGDGHDRALERGHVHTANVATATWRPSQAADLDTVRRALGESGLLRAKGSVTTREGPQIIHLAGERVTVEPTGDALDAVVLIGPDQSTVDAVIIALDAG